MEPFLFRKALVSNVFIATMLQQHFQYFQNMNYTLLIATLTALLFFSSCQNQSETSTQTSQAENSALKPESWITERVEKAKARLDSTEAGKIVWQAMEAHGGLQTWYSNGPLSFHFNYVPLDGSTVRNTYQTIDTWSNKARHQNVADQTQEFGWTGQKAWKQVRDSTSFPFDMKFWALTPYYFLGQPFVLDGEGVKLEKLADASHKGTSYDAIKVSFEAGTGDAPDDYYVLYFGKNDHKLAVIRYIVSYPAYFESGKHMPEKFMELQGTTVVKGIELATGHHTHWLTEDGQAGEHITTITVDDIKFDPAIKNAYFERPEGAQVIK